MDIFNERLDRPDKALKAWQAAEGIAPHGYRSAREAQFHIAESIAQGDFPVQITPAVRKTMTVVYDETPSQIGAFTTRKTVQGIDVDEELNVYDFGNQENIPAENHGERFIPGGLPNVQNRERYPQLKMRASGKKLRASTFGEGFGIDWQALINLRGANVNLIRDAANAFGEHAKNQEDINVALQLVNAAGTGFATGNGKALADAYAVPGNPNFDDPDTIPNTIQALLQRKVEGKRAKYTRYALIVAPAMVGAAERSLQTRTITSVPARTGTDSAERGIQFQQTIPLGASVTVIGWDWLPEVFSGIGAGWLLIPIVDSGTSVRSLPVLSSNYLEGYETPSMFIKDSNSRRLTGAGGVGSAVSPLDGDFDQDAILTKVRHVHGSTALWTAGIAYSAGTNT